MDFNVMCEKRKLINRFREKQRFVNFMYMTLKQDERREKLYIYK